jgi:hypothetical protein
MRKGIAPVAGLLLQDGSFWLEPVKASRDRTVNPI